MIAKHGKNSARDKRNATARKAAEERVKRALNVNVLYFVFTVLSNLLNSD